MTIPLAYLLPSESLSCCGFADHARPRLSDALPVQPLPGNEAVMRQGRYGEDGDCIHRSEVEDAIAYATSRGWSVESGDGRVRIYCANTERDGCQIGINATPLDTATHAKQIRRAVDRCPHSVEGVD